MELYRGIDNITIDVRDASRPTQEDFQGLGSVNSSRLKNRGQYLQVEAVIDLRVTGIIFSTKSNSETDNQFVQLRQKEDVSIRNISGVLLVA
eukprot:IDg4669t1